MATTLKRTQMYFPEDLLQQVRQIAESEHTTIAEVVRNAVGEFLDRKKKKQIDWENDPMWDLLVQTEGSGRDDGATDHDAYLYGGKQ